MASTDSLKRKAGAMEQDSPAPVPPSSSSSAGKRYLAEQLSAMHGALREATYYRAMIVRFQADLYARNLTHIHPRPPAHLLKAFARACMTYHESRERIRVYLAQASIAYADAQKRGELESSAAQSDSAQSGTAREPDPLADGVDVKPSAPTQGRDAQAGAASASSSDQPQPQSQAELQAQAKAPDVIDIDALPTPIQVGGDGVGSEGRAIDVDASGARGDDGKTSGAAQGSASVKREATHEKQASGGDPAVPSQEASLNNAGPPINEPSLNAEANVNTSSIPDDLNMGLGLGLGLGFDPSQFMASFDSALLGGGADDSGMNTAALGPSSSEMPAFDGSAGWDAAQVPNSGGNNDSTAAAQVGAPQPDLSSAAAPMDFSAMDMDLDQFAELMKTLPPDAIGASGGADGGGDAPAPAPGVTADDPALPAFDASAMLGMTQEDWAGIDLDSMLGSYFQAEGGQDGAQ